MRLSPERPVLFFDGVCNLCNASVQFVIRHDKRKRILFASLQSARGQEAVKQLQKAGRKTESFILQDKGTYYTRSSAVLRAAMIMGGVFRLMAVGFIIPAFIRNALYDWVAKNRYKWFGKRDSCMIPTPEIQSRFIDDSVGA